MLGSAEHLLAIINDVLDISKIEIRRSWYSRWRPSASSMSSRRLVSLNADKVTTKGLSSRTAVGSLPPVLVGDRTRLSQAFAELCRQCHQIHGVRQHRAARIGCRGKMMLRCWCVSRCRTAASVSPAMC